MRHLPSTDSTVIQPKQPERQFTDKKNTHSKNCWHFIVHKDNSPANPVIFSSKIYLLPQSPVYRKEKEPLYEPVNYHLHLFSIAGYLSGSILYAYWIPKILFQKDICALSPDGNPGTANAFVYGGFRAGILALLLELFKGFFPVVLALRTLDIDTPYMIPILIAPVLGHAFPLQFHPKNSNKKGGKAIAVSFGVLLGIFPVVLPVLFLAAAYILFSVVLIIQPHLFRSIITFGVFCLLVFLFVPVLSIDFACLGIALLVIYKHLCAYQNEKLSIRFFFQK
ncbi:MAG: glycerol-3-phosphate acyltransferase [Roseburia sp.]